jgi:hypothetical protein
MYQGGLSFGDGFKFGCGFMLAAVVSWIIIGIVGMVITLLAGLLGMGAMIPFMQNTIR